MDAGAYRTRAAAKCRGGKLPRNEAALAQRAKIDRGLSSQLDELEQRMFLLKIQYEKYFSGTEKVEPSRERELIQRFVRDLMEDATAIKNPTQRHRFDGLRARLGSFEYYWTRQLRMLEQGTHPRQKFKQKIREQEKEELLRAESEKLARQRQRRRHSSERDEEAYRSLYQQYMEVRGKCGQDPNVPFETVRQALEKQADVLKAKYKCKSIKFKVVEEGGKARVKATPVT
jgi:hypothetical protein